MFGCLFNHSQQVWWVDKKDMESSKLQSPCQPSWNVAGMFTFHQTYSFKCWNSSLFSFKIQFWPSCFVAHYIIRVSIGSKTLGMTLKYPLGPRGTCKDFLWFSCAKGCKHFLCKFWWSWGGYNVETSRGSVLEGAWVF